MGWDVHGKTVLITGATSGIGLEASADLARRGARVVMVGRDPERTERARGAVAGRSGSPEVTTLLCDFASQAAIRALAAAFRERHDRLDVLINNAGGVHKKRRLTVDGIEATFAVNHLGYFLLTNLLADLLVKSAPARVVSVSSIGHRRGTMDLDDVGFEKGYAIMKAYSRSKLANILFTSELARRLAGTGVTANCLHPGAVDTGIWSGAPLWAKPVIQLVFRRFFIDARAGAAYVVDLAANPALEGVTGAYFEKGTRLAPAPLAQDAALAGRLWEKSARLVSLAPAEARL
jgi:NAD(P)-dependent dehydrogenase (short-subunit alcohol dehydrogenase family)